MTSHQEVGGLIDRVWVVRVFVSSQEDAIAFFRDILEIPVALHAPRYGWVEVGPSDARAKIALQEPNPDTDPIIFEWEKEQVGTSTGIVFETKDIEGLYHRLKNRGVHFTLPPQQMSWGGLMAIFEDPDGNRYQVVEDPEHYTRDYG